MTFFMVAPLALSVLLALTGAWLGRLLPPATAVRLLSTTALISALTTGFVLTMAAFVAAAQLEPVAAIGHWSARALAAGEPVPRPVGLICGAFVATLMGLAVWRVLRTGQDLFAAAAACRRLGNGTAGLVILEDDTPDAYAIPALPGRVVVSTSMLRALSAPERRVLLAHEESHLRHHHHLYVQITELAAAANPLLRPIARAVRAGVERWADEDAAAATGDRTLAARTVARASLARRGARSAQRPAAALHMSDGPAIARTKALLAPPPTPRPALAIAVAALILTGCAGAIAVGHDTEHLFEVALSAYSRSH